MKRLLQHLAALCGTHVLRQDADIALLRRWTTSSGGFRDLFLRTHVAALLKQYEVNCVIDVGANVGQYANELRKAGYSNRIVSFEPVAAAFNRLSQNSSSDPNWQVFPQALGNTHHHTDILVPSQSVFSSFYEASNAAKQHFGLVSQGADRQRVEVNRLDALFDTICSDIENPRVFLKMDTQGSDLQVFEGSSGCLDRIVALQTEVALVPMYENVPRLCEVLSILEASGFEVAGLHPVTRDRRAGRILELDCTMVRVDSLPPRAAEIWR